MPVAHTPTTAELMLRLLESLSLAPATPEQVLRQLRRAYPLTGLARRVRSGLDVLAAEGLVEPDDDGGRTVFHTTASGLATLERHGRYPGAAAVMFTDIVGSTELIGQHGEEGAHRLRQRHFELLRRELARHDGREVKNLGDGLMAVFADAAAATHCAAAMQRGAARDRDRLGLRVGLHAGELLREGNDYFGTTVIVAQRLCDVATSGEIVASQEVCAQIEDDDEPPFTLRGPVALKGLDEPVSAVTVAWSRQASGDGLVRDSAAHAARHPRPALGAAR